MRRALHAELTKLRTTPAGRWLPLASVAATAGLGALVSAAADPASTACASGCDPARLALSGVYLGQLPLVALAVVTGAGEHRPTTLLAVPARLIAFTARTVALTSVVLPAAILAVALALATGRAPSSAWRAGAGTVGYLVLVTLLALGVAATLRRTVAALGLVLGLLYLAPVVAQFVTGERWRLWIERAAPSGSDPPWTGLAALTAWTAAALLAGATTFTRRDA